MFDSNHYTNIKHFKYQVCKNIIITLISCFGMVHYLKIVETKWVENSIGHWYYLFNMPPTLLNYSYLFNSNSKLKSNYCKLFSLVSYFNYGSLVLDKYLQLWTFRTAFKPAISFQTLRTMYVLRELGMTREICGICLT